MGKFSKFTGEVELSVDVEGKPFKFTVKPTNRQIAKMMAQDKKKRQSEDGLIETDNILIDMIIKANPPEDGEDVDKHKDETTNFVMAKKVDIMTQFAIAMGWTTQEQIDKAIAKAEKEDEESGK